MLTWFRFGLLVALALTTSQGGSKTWNSQVRPYKVPCLENGTMPAFSFKLSEKFRPENAYLALWASVVAELHDGDKILKALDDWGFEQPYLISEASPGWHGFLAEAEDYRLLVFRGTQSLGESVIDSMFFTSSYEDIELAGRGHTGFRIAMKMLWGRLYPELQRRQQAAPKPLIVAGHSLGGATALLHALRLAKMGFRVSALYTSGQPRVGDEIFYQQVDELLGDRYFRMEDPADWTAKVPPSRGAAVNFANLLTAAPHPAHDLMTQIIEGVAYSVPDNLRLELNDRLETKQGGELSLEQQFWDEVGSLVDAVASLDDLKAELGRQEMRHRPTTYLCRFMDAYRR